MKLLKNLFRRREADLELTDEMIFHLEKQIEQNIARGMAPDEARRQALIAFGGVQQTREDVRRVRWPHLLDHVAQDLRYAFRMLRNSPRFTAIAVLTLTLAIGMNTAIFSLLNEVLFRALPADRPEELVLLRWHTRKAPRTIGYMSYGDCIETFIDTSGCSLPLPYFKAVRTQREAFSSLAAFAGMPSRLVLSTGGPATMVDNGLLVSGEYFQTVGVGAALGRTLGPEDDMPGAPPVLLLSYRYWQSMFGGQPSVVGTTVRLNGVPFVIVGVADKRFAGLHPGARVDFWVPLAMRNQLLAADFKDGKQEGLTTWWLLIIGRRKPGVSLAHAEAALSLPYRDQMVQGDKPIFQAADDPGVTLVPAREALKGFYVDSLPPLYVLMTVTSLVLLIACATIAGLLLARATARQKEIAIRLTLGARRGRLISQLLAENVLLSAIGGALGLVVAVWGARVLLAALSEGPASPQFTPRIDLRVLAFTAAVSILAGVLFGLAPALRSLRADLTPVLNSCSGAVSAARSRRGWLNLGNGLVAAQVSLAMVALVCAGMLLHTLQNLRNVDPGFATDNILLFGIDGGSAGYEQERADGLYRDLRDKFAALPGVGSTGYSFASLLSGSRRVGAIHAPGTPENARDDVDVFAVGPGFLSTMRIPVQAGRDLNDADYLISRQNAAGVRPVAAAGLATAKKAPEKVPLPALVNETFARRYFPRSGALGQLIEAPIPFGPYPRGPGWRIVGLVHDAKYNDLRRDISPTMYVPASGGSAVFELRTAGDPTRLVPAVREIVNQTDKNLALFDITTQSAQIDEQLFVERRIAQLSSFFGVLALVLACGGIYGLLAYDVARRTREIGIRMAIGAQQSDVVSMVVRHGMLVAIIGAAVGAAASFALKKLLDSILYQVKPGDPITLVSVTALLLLVALAACYLPARRATRVDPLVALREE